MTEQEQMELIAYQSSCEAILSLADGLISYGTAAYNLGSSGVSAGQSALASSSSPSTMTLPAANNVKSQLQIAMGNMSAAEAPLNSTISQCPGMSASLASAISSAQSKPAYLQSYAQTFIPQAESRKSQIDSGQVACQSLLATGQSVYAQCAARLPEVEARISQLMSGM